MSGLSFAQLEKQLEEYNILLTTPIHFDPVVVIRDERGDSGIAAVHIDKGRLVFDVGKRMP